MKVLGIILARAGSKGLKDKHILPLLGKPVIMYTFEHALASKRLNKIVLTTDSKEIIEIAKKINGIEIIERPSELCRDDTPVEEVWRHAVKTVQKQGFTPQIIVNLYGNVPIRRKGIIDDVIEFMIKTKADIVRTYTPVGKYHPAWMLRIDKEYNIHPIRESTKIYRRQDLEDYYIHDGAVDAITFEALMCRNIPYRGPFNDYNENIKAYIQKEGDTVEIDNILDIKIAEAFLRK